jgi:16S rRNA (adenine1518-N6/adenine1519-N6)-dimethyltransferase
VTAVGFEHPVTVLRRYHLTAKKSWGQNFLVSEGAVRALTDCCVPSPGTRVIEIGAGLGTLTGALLGAGARVIAVERDRDMCAVLEGEFGGHPDFTLCAADAATFDFGNPPGGVVDVIAGNLPYQITGAILRRIMDCTPPPAKAVFMVQEEVATRICAGIDDRERAALSVMLDGRFSASVVLRLKPTAFFPAPKVRSAVVALIPRHPSLLTGLEPRHFDILVKSAFATRRKTIRNSFLHSGFAPPDAVDALLSAVGIDPTVRAEKLTTAAFIALTREATRAGLFSGADGTPEEHP